MGSEDRVPQTGGKHMANITGAIPEINHENNSISQEQLQHEVDYVRAQQILTTMLDCGLISLSEFNKITDLNRKTFSPLLAEIMA